MTKAIYALYSDPHAAERAVSSIEAAGISPRDVAVISSQPFEEFEFGRRDAATPMPWMAAAGGLAGGAGGYLLAALTEKAYPIPTGGMPIVVNWTNGIISYELTMLGAVLATVLTLLVAARLPNWRKQLYDPEISDGKILVGVVNPAEDSRVEVERRLREAGAQVVKEFPPSSKSVSKP